MRDVIVINRGVVGCGRQRVVVAREVPLAVAVADHVLQLLHVLGAASLADYFYLENARKALDRWVIVRYRIDQKVKSGGPFVVWLQELG